MRTNLPRAVVHLRHRRGWRQSDLADRSGVSRSVISRIEHDDLGGLSVRSLTRVVEALDASAELVVRWHGEQLDRLIDADHARIVQGIVLLLESLEWMTRVEVSFNHYGDRGRVDVLAMHARSRTLLVVEAKSAIGDTQDTVGRLDVKVRLGPMLASSVGWDEPARIVPALVIADSRAARRVVAEHDGLFLRFDLRGRGALAWLRRPESAEPGGALWFANLPNARGSGAKQRIRVQKRRGRS
jgi:transcriptional regulator with XRE-family HTH domain